MLSLFPKPYTLCQKTTNDIPSTLIIELLFQFNLSVVKVQLRLLVPEVYFSQNLNEAEYFVAHCGPNNNSKVAEYNLTYKNQDLTPA